MNQLFLPIKINCRHSPYLIRVEHERLIIESDLEMTAHVRLVYFTDNNGEFGEPVLDVIRNNPDLTPSQKSHDMERFKTIRWQSTTRGAMVDPETGITVLPDQDGSYPEGSITQLQYWQQEIGRAHV